MPAKTNLTCAVCSSPGPGAKATFWTPKRGQHWACYGCAEAVRARWAAEAEDIHLLSAPERIDAILDELITERIEAVETPPKTETWDLSGVYDGDSP